jgi:hypothetical protein
LKLPVRRQNLTRPVIAIGHAAGMLELLKLLLGVIPTALRSRRDLVLENLLLRHQLAVAAGPKRRPQLRTWDRLLWLLGRRSCCDWRRHPVSGPKSGRGSRRPFVHVVQTAQDRPASDRAGAGARQRRWRLEDQRPVWPLEVVEADELGQNLSCSGCGSAEFQRAHATRS